MKHDWIIDVLSDLRQYALANYRIALAEQLDDAIMVAAAEMRRDGGEAEEAVEPRRHETKRPALTSI